MLIPLGSSATLQNAENLRLELIAAIEANACIELDAAGIQDIDLSTIQVIEAARLQVEALRLEGAANGAVPGPRLELIGAANPVVDEILDRAGFFPTTDIERCRFWGRAEDQQ